MESSALPRLGVPFLTAWLAVTASAVGLAQGLTGAIVATVTDPQGAVLTGVVARLSSPALIGGPWTQRTDARGHLRFPALPPGLYTLDISFKGFAPHHETAIDVSAGSTTDLRIPMKIAGVTESVTVEAARPRLDARNPGFATSWNDGDLRGIPMRRASMFDPLRATPGLSPTSPSGSAAGGPTVTSLSAFGSGTNENIFLLNDTSTTCPCNGVSRSEPSVDFIKAIHIQSIGASAEYGSVPGAVINVIMREGSDRFALDTSYFGQTSSLTSQPILRPYASGERSSGYERVKYHDVTVSLGGPALRDRLWFFGGYQRVRDHDSQPGADPRFPRTYEQDKSLLNLTWKLGSAWRLTQSVQYESWVSPEQPTSVKPFESTQTRHATVPVITFGNLTHVLSDRTIWELRVGRFVHARVDDPSSGDRRIPSRFNFATKVWSGGPAQLGTLTLERTSAKAMLTTYRPGFWRADHQLRAGGQFEQGEGYGLTVIPTGVRYIDQTNPPQAVVQEPSLSGGLSRTFSGFVSDDVTVRNQLTFSLGVRFDYSRAVSQDLPALDGDGNETGAIVPGRGTLYTWNVVSPRLGVTLRLTADGRTMLRGSYGRFSQGVLTGEFSTYHPGATPVTTFDLDPATGLYSASPRVTDPRLNVSIDPDIRAPHTHQFSAGLDRELGAGFSASSVYVYKRGRDFIGWTEVAGQYVERMWTGHGHALPVFDLVGHPSQRLFRLTNPDGYSLTYHGLVLAAERRRGRGWQMLGSYTWSRTEGLQASSGATAGAPQSSSVALPTAPIGRDPNDLTNARGRLPNDRPHIFRIMASTNVPRTGLVVAANLQHFSGKPWAATADIPLKQGNLRVLLEPRGTRRLPSQTLLDLRIARPFQFGRMGRVELLVDVLNALNDSAAEELASDSLSSTSFGVPTVFIDPRRALLGVRWNLGR